MPKSKYGFRGDGVGYSARPDEPQFTPNGEPIMQSKGDWIAAGCGVGIAILIAIAAVLSL